MENDFEAIIKITYEAVRNLETMEKILKDDIKRTHKLAESEEDGDIIVRATLRATFAYIEAMVFCLKTIAFRLSDFGQGDFSSAEIAMLVENTYDVDDKGEVKTHVKFIPLAKNIRFAFDAGARALALHFELNVGDTGWNSFKRALAIRNRITHPKSAADLHISEEDYEHIKKGFDWFAENFRSFRQEYHNKLQMVLKYAKGDASSA